MTAQSPRPVSPRWASALAGVAAGAAALAASELAAGLLGGPSLVVAAGTLAIDLQPPGAKDVVVSLFGTNDKAALIGLVVVIVLAVAAVAGILAARRFILGASVFVVFGFVAAGAAIRLPLVEPVLAVVDAAIAVCAGLVILRLLLGLIGRRDAAAAATEPTSAEWTRRRFLIASAGTIGAAAVVGGVGRSLIDAQHVEGVVSTSSLPEAPRGRRAPGAGPGADDARAHAARGAERRLLPDRHGAPRAPGWTSRPGS